MHAGKAPACLRSGDMMPEMRARVWKTDGGRLGIPESAQCYSFLEVVQTRKKKHTERNKQTRTSNRGVYACGAHIATQRRHNEILCRLRPLAERRSTLFES